MLEEVLQRERMSYARGNCSRDVACLFPDNGTRKYLHDTKKCANSLGLEVQSVVAREFFPQG
jgi:hypothetical protein